MFGIWSWIEQSAYAAFMRGIQRGVDQLTTAETGDGPAPVLRLTFAPAEEPKGEPAKGRRKAE